MQYWVGLEVTTKKRPLSIIRLKYSNSFRAMWSHMGTLGYLAEFENNDQEETSPLSSKNTAIIPEFLL